MTFRIFLTKHRRIIFFYLIDIALVTFSFLIFIWIKPASLRIYLPYYLDPFLIFLGIWLAASIPSKKYTYNDKNTLSDFLNPVLISDFIALSVITLMIVAYNRFTYSRMIVFGTIGLSFILEILLFSLFYYYRKLNRNSENGDTVMTYIRDMEKLAATVDSQQLPEPENTEHYPVFTLSNYKDQIIDEAGLDTYDFIRNHVAHAQNRTLVLSTTTQFNVKSVPSDVFNVIVNLKPINDIKRVNKFIEAVNSKLPVGGLYVDCVITNEIKKRRILKMYPPVFNYIIYFFYYIFKRLFPKLPVLKKFYFFMTNGYDRALSKAEAFGRLYSCGFEVLAEDSGKDSLFFVSRKVTEPLFDMNPTYGALISLKRIGKNGKLINVYKFRTMHPYSEYLQEYIFANNQLQEGGKFREDYRISTAGRLMRKLWIDELPMLINLLRGDLKLVGVRPLSRHYFSLYSEELKEKRIKYKPGLVPPFYADMPKTLDEIMDSESRYLDAYAKNPLITDFRYFWKAFSNIVFRRARSK
jgi:hypothetical protein